MRPFKTLLLLGLLLLLPACSRRPPVAHPTPTPSPPPAGVLAARDAALSHVRELYPLRAPAADLTWTRCSPPPDEAAREAWEWESGDWKLTIYAPGPGQDCPPCEAVLQCFAANCDWRGVLDADVRVIESNMNVAPEARVTRDAVLDYLAQAHPDDAPGPGLVWLGVRTTPEGQNTHESYRFDAWPWQMVVEYELVPAERRHYRLTLYNAESDARWHGQMLATGEVLEIRP